MQPSTSALKFEEYQAEVRLTPDNRISVFDLIRVIGGQKNPREVWKRLCTKSSAEYSEVVSFCDSFKFPGRGQQETPVIGKEGALVLLGILPGEVGRKYRLDAAKLMLSYLEAPEELAKKAIERIEDKEKLEDVISTAQQKYISKYHPLFDELRDRVSLGYADQSVINIHNKLEQTCINVNTLNTTIVLGRKPKDIVQERGGENARAKLSIQEYNQYSMLQDAQLIALSRKPDAEKSSEIYEVCKKTATKFADFLNSL